MEHARAALKRAEEALKASGYAEPNPYARADAYLRERERRLAAPEPKVRDAKMGSDYATHADIEFVGDALVKIHNDLADDLAAKTDKNNNTLIDIVADIEARFEARLENLEQEIRTLRANASAKSNQECGDGN